MASLHVIERHLDALRACSRCPAMHGPPVAGRPNAQAQILLVGQAPGSREIVEARPFAYTAGKTLFGWLEGALGLDEEALRSRLWFSAVCRCFPGKKPRGGDRVPSPDEIERCAPWLDDELRLLRPRLVLAVGKLAISRFLDVPRLDDVVGELFPAERAGVRFELLPLPHPSGVSTWHRQEPGRTLLARALERLREHPAARGASLVESARKAGQKSPSLLRSSRDAKA